MNFEAGAAWLARKTLIPVCFGNISKGTLPKPYANFQAVDLASPLEVFLASVGTAAKLFPAFLSLLGDIVNRKSERSRRDAVAEAVWEDARAKKLANIREVCRAPSRPGSCRGISGKASPRHSRTFLLVSPCFPDDGDEFRGGEKRL